MIPPSAAARAAESIHEALEKQQLQLLGITRRVRQRFEVRDWKDIRQATLERLELPAQSIRETVEVLQRQLGAAIDDHETWVALKAEYTRRILGRDDFEIAQSFFNSLTRKVFPHAGVDPAIDYVAEELPLPFYGWEMASARMYAVRRIDAAVVRRVLEDAGFHVSFRDLAGDAGLAAERLREGVIAAFGSPAIEAVDVLRPVFFRNKGAYIVGRARLGPSVMPLLLAVVHGAEGLRLDAALCTEDEASIVFSFARWYFHVDVESPREVIGFLKSILPRKRIAELYISLGYKNHGKTEFYRDLMSHITNTDEQFAEARGQQGLVMEVFNLPSYEWVFKVVKDVFPPQKNTSRERVMEKYGQVQLLDRVGRLVGFQEFEHLKIPRARFAPELLARLLQVAGRTLSAEGDWVTIRHCYVERRVVPLDLFLREMDAERAEAAVLDWGRCLKELAAANVFPGDVLLKNFGVTRHDRVLSYDYDELSALTDIVFRELPPPRDEQEELAAEPWFTVGENDVFPAELRTFLGLQGRLLDAFLREHADLFTVEFWQDLQERHRRGEVPSFFPYGSARRLRSGEGTREAVRPAMSFSER
ncbi:MAG TPA: bifunctional isocitrate dehydrogenase kinase/phosphatase [Thermoanaerobaculia bacterium]|jgi:isocitrate dehydrogenase kinase/phosphatase|nr:bifunctional isocitrate dehydrogenase kinase/phosphatase [Thermoanaerobaculia bacterium]